MITHNYKDLHIWRIVEIKFHPLKNPNRTWPDKKAARARPLITVADVPNGVKKSPQRRPPHPLPYSSLPQSANISRHSHSMVEYNLEGATPCASMRSFASSARLTAKPRSQGGLREMGRKDVGLQQNEG